MPGSKNIPQSKFIILLKQYNQGRVIGVPMKILQLDVDNITYTPVKPEAKLYDDVKKEPVSIDNALVLMVSVEEGDTTATADKVLAETKSFLDKLQRKKLVIYPYAHLSNNLASPEEAQKIINYLFRNAPEGIEALKGPFGWNKKLSLDIKGHPLAEQSRSYTATGGEEKAYKKPKPISVNTSIVRKSNWSGLPDTDHRTIGEKLDLYSFQEVSPGMTYWHNNGYILFLELLKFIRDKLEEYGYREVATPAISNLALWHVSGHIDHYKVNMFVFESENQEYGLKPMNCPSTILIYKSKKWSYRDLPIRFADFDKLYRNEISGALTGLFRVRELTQDDAHLFVREDQVEQELTSLLRLVNELYSKFDLEYTARLSTMPDSHLGSEELWTTATESLKNALNANGIGIEVKEKEGAFYGPKIDFDIKDSMGREWQCATVQLDYQLPQRFKLEYTGEDGKQHTPVIIHRVIYGSLERFIGILTEHTQGNFPTWLAPIQVRVIPVSQQANSYAEKVYAKIKESRIRVEMDLGDKTMENKLREAILQKVPYMLVVGKKEEDAGTVAVRCRGGAQKSGVKLEEFIDKLEKEVKNREGKLMY